MYTLTSWIQLERFLRLIYAIDVPQINIVLDRNVREAIVNPGVTRPSRSVPPLTNDVRVIFCEMNLQKMTPEVCTRNSNMWLHSCAI
jgi:hypothetical protein